MARTCLPDIPIQIEDVYIAGYPVSQHMTWDSITIGTAVKTQVLCLLPVHLKACLHSSV